MDVHSQCDMDVTNIFVVAIFNLTLQSFSGGTLIGVRSNSPGDLGSYRSLTAFGGVFGVFSMSPPSMFVVTFISVSSSVTSWSILLLSCFRERSSPVKYFSFSFAITCPIVTFDTRDTKDLDVEI